MRIVMNDFVPSMHEVGRSLRYSSIRSGYARTTHWRCNKTRSECKQIAPSLSALYLGTRAKRIRESEMTPPAEMSGQHQTARQQSRAAWGAVARGWYAQREELWKASRPVSEWMVRRLDPQPGDTVLELAAGLADTGLMAARLVGESGCVIVTDFTPEMVAAARRRAEELGLQNAEFRVLDAERMDLKTDIVDGVLCRWAYMLMIDPPAAFAETRRVLRPGGRLAFSVWAARERNPALALVVGAGFAEPEIEEVTFRWPFAEKDAYWHYVTETAASASPVLRALSPEEQNTVRERVHEAAREYRSGEGYDFMAVCLNAVTY